MENSTTVDDPRRESQAFDFLVQQFAVSRSWTLSLQYLGEEYLIRYADSDAAKKLIRCVKNRDMFTLSKSPYGYVVCCSTIPTIEAEEILRVFYEALLLRLSEGSCSIDVLIAYMTEAPAMLTDSNFFEKLEDTFVVRKDDEPKVCLHASKLSKHLTHYLRKYFVGAKAFCRDSAVPLQQVLRHISSSAPHAIRNHFAGPEAIEELQKHLQQHSLQFSTTESSTVYLVSRHTPSWLSGLEQAARYFHQILYAFKLCGHEKVCFNVLLSCVKVSQEPAKFFLSTEFPSTALVDFFQSMPEYFDTFSTFNCVAPVCEDDPETSAEHNNLKIATLEYYVTLLWIASAELKVEVLQLCLQYGGEKVRKYCLNKYPTGIAHFFLQYPCVFEVSKDRGAVKLCLDVPRFCPSDEVQSENMTQAVVNSRYELIKEVMQGTCSLKKYELLSVFLRRNDCFMLKGNEVVLTNRLRLKLYDQGSSSLHSSSSASITESSTLGVNRNVSINYFVSVLTAQPGGLTFLQLEEALHKSPASVQAYFQSNSFKSFFTENTEAFVVLNSGCICARQKRDSQEEQGRFHQLLKIQKAVKTFDELLPKILTPLNNICTIETLEDIARRTCEAEVSIIKQCYKGGFVGFLRTRTHLFESSHGGSSGGTLKSESCSGTVTAVATEYGTIRLEHVSVLFPSWTFIEYSHSHALHSKLKVGDTVEVQYLFYTTDNPCVTSVIKVENHDRAEAELETRDCTVVFAGPYYALLALKQCDGSTDTDVTVVYANVDILEDLRTGDSIKVRVRPSYPSATVWKAYELGNESVAKEQTKSRQPVLPAKEEAKCKKSAPPKCVSAATAVAPKKLKNAVLHDAIAYFANAIGDTQSEASLTKLEGALQKSPKPIQEFCLKNFPDFLRFFEKYGHAFNVSKGGKIIRTLPMDPQLDPKKGSVQAEAEGKGRTVVPVQATGNAKSSSSSAVHGKPQTNSSVKSNNISSQKLQTVPQMAKEVTRCKKSAPSKCVSAATAVAPKKPKNAVLHDAIAYFANAIGDKGTTATLTKLEDAFHKSPKPIQEFCLKNFPDFLGFFEKYGHAFTVSIGGKVIRTLPMDPQFDPKKGSVQAEADRKSHTEIPVQAKGNAKGSSSSTANVKPQTNNVKSNSISSQKSQIVQPKANVQEVRPVQVQTCLQTSAGVHVQTGAHTQTRSITKTSTQIMATVGSADQCKLYEILEVNDTQSTHFATTTSNPFKYAVLGTLSGLWEQGAQITAKNYPSPIAVYPWAFIQDSGTVTVKMTPAWQLGDTVEFDAVHDPGERSPFVTCVVKVSKAISDVPPKSYACEAILVTTYYALLRLVPGDHRNEMVPADQTLLLFSDPKGVKLVPFQRMVAEAVPDYPSPNLWKVCSLTDYQTRAHIVTNEIA